MKYVWILLFGLLVFGCQSASQDNATLQEVVNKNNQDEIIETGYMRNGKKTGPWTTYYDGKDAGRLKSVKHYIDGELYGAALVFNNRGQLTDENHFVAGKKNGRSAKYQWGVTVEEMNYKNDLLDGLYQSYYRNNRKPQKVAHYKEGKLDGLYEYYNEEGKKVMEYEYVDGEKVEGGMVN
ncbi:MAG: hypothetical protein KDC24_10390 [Saprospiraceae bacterium]|nr:hypothetical protein [Saprospiraceae bacterium]